jgi:DNA end-binding protein Ku
MLRFAHEIVDPNEVRVPEIKDLNNQEMALANTLIETMCGAFEPSEYTDEYRQQLMDVIQQKVEGVAPAASGPASQVAASAVDLMEVLKQSLKDRKPTPLKETTVATTSRRKAKKKKTTKTRCSA